MRILLYAFTEQPQQPTNTTILTSTYSSAFGTAQAAEWSDYWGGAV